jgi:ATP-dependent helicase/nuclease subunit B
MTTAQRLSLAEPLDDADVPVAELVARTRHEEARTVMATVAGLRDHGVPIRDIAVVARDLDPYEEPFYRAAIQYGITPVFWLQLRVTQTRLYGLIESVCDVLGSEHHSRAALCRPLEYRWCPPAATASKWPLRPKTIQHSLQALPDTSQSLDEWHDELKRNPAVDDRLLTYVEWLIECPEPTPTAVTEVLLDLVDRYAELGVPVTEAHDSPALLETERDTRAVIRVQTLIRQLSQKYAESLDDGPHTRSWEHVGEVAHLIAAQRPGRREHSNARAVDIFEANDVWLLDIPYVITAGLVNGEWPKNADSVVPPELQEVILQGADRVGTLAPRTSWTTGRDRDQFADTVATAGTGLIVTRYTETSTGDTRHPSPLLKQLNTTTVPEVERQRLVSPDRDLPVAIREMLDNEEGSADE